MARVNIYTNNPTAGGTDGTLVSQGTLNSPISANLDASNNESQIIKCAIRCETGYQTAGSTTLSFSGTTAAKWSICADDNYANETAAAAGSYNSFLTITGTINATNTIFWVKASSSSDESLGVDTSVQINAVGKVMAVS